MFLKSLTVRSQGTVIREVGFRRGLNLIVDTTTTAPTDSGNNVGKTTFLRIIDYCLGGAGEAIYEDPEFKKQRNEAVYRYLTEKDVEFELILESHSAKTTTIVRRISAKPKLNGVELSIAEFRSCLGLELFGMKGLKPTFRQLIPKFVRIAQAEISNTIYYLHTSTAKHEYEPIYLFLFGFRDQVLLDRRRRHLLDLKKWKERHQALTSLFSKASLVQILTVLDRDIAKSREQEQRFQVSDAVISEVHRLEEVRRDIAELSMELGNAGLKLRLNQEAIQRLEKASSEIDVRVVVEIYHEASVELGNLSRKLSEVIQFHNQMITNKIRFVRISIEKLDKEIGEIQGKLAELFEKERVLLESVSNRGALSDLHKIHKALEELTTQRARKEALLGELEEVSVQLDKTVKNLDEVNESILVYRLELEKRVGEFNLIFSEFSRKLYDDEYVLVFDFAEDKGPKLFEVRIANIRGNEGTGAKRAQISAFDLAYLELLARQQATSVRFTLHDRVEDVSINQLKTLFATADKIDGQYVVAVLSDKISTIDPDWTKNRTILTLSQEDRFFKIP